MLYDTIVFLSSFHHFTPFPDIMRTGLFNVDILARGVTNALPLGEVERMFGGMPHDGMMVLNDLVDWKNG